MKKMRKVVSLILSLVLLITCVPSSFAKSKETNMYVQHIGHGQYEIVGKKDGELATHLEEDIYTLEDGTYLSKMSETSLLKVERLFFNLVDRESIQQTLSQYNFDDVIITDILNQSDKAIENGNNDATITLYTSIPNSLIRASTTTFYNYNGKNFQNVIIYYNTLETSWTTVENGPDTKEVAAGTLGLVVAGGGLISGTIGTVFTIFGVGVSALSFFLDAVGASSISGSYDDKFQVNVRYDIQTKYTSYEQVKGSGVYTLGCVTQSAYIHRIETYQYYMTDIGGKSETTLEYVYEYRKTPNFDNPYDKATYWVGDPWTEYSHMEIGGKTISW